MATARKKTTAKKALTNTSNERHPRLPQPGFQSDEARAKAGELHAAESRMEAIHGAASTVGRHNQGKRDQR